MKHWKEIVKSGAISGWTDEDHKFEVSLSLSLSPLSLSIYMYISSYCIIFSRSVLRYLVIHRVGDNGRTVNTWIRRRLRTFLISWGQKTRVNCLTLLCWFVVMIWVLVCKNMYRYERYFPRWSDVSLIAQSLTCLPGPGDSSTIKIYLRFDVSIKYFYTVWCFM